MAKLVTNIDKFHDTRKGKLTFGVVELVLAAVVMTRAIDTGSIWEWIIGLLFFIGGLNNLVRTLFRQVKSDAKDKAKKR